ncbi:hypothetical protein F4801DRAFT_575958 [Xylaria longipes]|nr:hypothetical protein F4801DRAFT_575958 [Xylaria longipes]
MRVFTLELNGSPKSKRYRIPSRSISTSPPSTGTNVVLISMPTAWTLFTEFFYKNEAFYQKRALELKIPYIRFSGFHTTKDNLGKSKLIEIAVSQLFSLDLDLVNLRKEAFGADIRTPETLDGRSSAETW